MRLVKFCRSNTCPRSLCTRVLPRARSLTRMYVRARLRSYVHTHTYTPPRPADRIHVIIRLRIIRNGDKRHVAAEPRLYFPAEVAKIRRRSCETRFLFLARGRDEVRRSGSLFEIRRRSRDDDGKARATSPTREPRRKESVYSANSPPTHVPRVCTFAGNSRRPSLARSFIKVSPTSRPDIPIGSRARVRSRA